MSTDRESLGPFPARADASGAAERDCVRAMWPSRAAALGVVAAFAILAGGLTSMVTRHTVPVAKADTTASAAVPVDHCAFQSYFPDARMKQIAVDECREIRRKAAAGS